jgi:hypothetical protein
VKLDAKRIEDEYKYEDELPIGSVSPVQYPYRFNKGQVYVREFKWHDTAAHSFAGLPVCTRLEDLEADIAIAPGVLFPSPGGLTFLVVC